MNLFAKFREIFLSEDSNLNQDPRTNPYSTLNVDFNQQEEPKREIDRYDFLNFPELTEFQVAMAKEWQELYSKIIRKKYGVAVADQHYVRRTLMNCFLDDALSTCARVTIVTGPLDALAVDRRACEKIEQLATQGLFGVILINNTAESLWEKLTNLIPEIKCKTISGFDADYEYLAFSANNTFMSSANKGLSTENLPECDFNREFCLGVHINTANEKFEYIRCYERAVFGQV